MNILLSESNIISINSYILQAHPVQVHLLLTQFPE